jgi:hypothetical protein
MSSLSEAVAAKKALSEPVVNCAEKDFRAVSTVTFCPWQATEWTVPWARLDAVSFSDEEESQRVEFFFPRHQVIVVGENLRGIMDDIRNFKVSCLRDLPASHRAKLTPDAVFIAQLEVRLLADLKNRPSADVPI